MGTRFHRPIVWSVSLVRRFCPKSGLGIELLVTTPIGTGFQALNLDGNSAEFVGGEKVVQLVSQAPWYSQPHEIHSHDQALLTSIRRRMSGLGVRIVGYGPTLALEQFRGSLERERGVVLRWLNTPSACKKAA